MNKQKAQLKNGRRGFTIVELAVVIVVVGILAGLSVFGYGAWRQHVGVDVLKSDLTHAAAQLKNDLNWTNTYPTTEADADGGHGLPKSGGTSYQYSYDAASRSYCLTATSNTSGVPAFHVSSNNNAVQEGPCAGHKGPTTGENTGGTGDSWTALPGNSAQWESVAYGDGKYVVVGDRSRVLTSSDGQEWNTVNLPTNQRASWIDVTYGNGKFVVVSRDYRIMSSTDGGATWGAKGSTWPATPGSNQSFSSITYGNGQFVAVSCGVNSFGTECNNNSGARMFTSPDGETWTARTTPAVGQWIDVTFGEGLFVAIGGTNSGGAKRVMTSPDGITWTVRSEPANASYTRLAYGGGRFVAVGSGRAMISEDGLQWTVVAGFPGGQWVGVTYGNGRFVAISPYETNSIISTDNGATWVTRASPSYGWRSIIYADDKFLAVGSQGIMTSP